ncbi:MAG: porin [Planctomycetota bacterium]|jgi:hypothetical protein
MHPLCARVARAIFPIAFVMVVAMTPSAAAQTGSDDPPPASVDERLERMQRELDALRGDNTALRDEVDRLRAETDEDWLTQQRADEIRALVHDVLADADTRSSLQGNGMTAGWSDGFFLASPDGRFKLQIGGQLQFRWIYNYHDQTGDERGIFDPRDPIADDRHRTGFETTRTKLIFKGHVFSPDIEFKVQLDQTRKEPNLVTGLTFLQDAWVRVHLDDQWNLRFGQFKLPFMREELVSSAQQLAIERSLVNENMSITRSQGIELTYARDFAKFSIAYSDGGSDNLGDRTRFNPIIGTYPLNTNWSLPDTEIALTARYEHLVAGNWSQFADFTSPPGDDFGILLGVAAHWQLGEFGVPTSVFFSGRDEVNWFAWTADASVEWGGANAFLSFTHSYVDTPAANINIFGFVAQGGVYLAPKWELFGRFEYGWWDIDATANISNPSDLTVGAVGVNYYIDGHDLKWSADFSIGFSQIETFWSKDITGFRPDLEGADPQVVFRTQFQLLF